MYFNLQTRFLPMALALLCSLRQIDFMRTERNAFSGTRFN